MDPSACRTSRRPLPNGSMRLLGFTVFLLSLIFAAAAAGAQTFDATNLHRPTDLEATWLAYGGDDPAYADPNFDDSKWVRVDPKLSLKIWFPTSHPEIVWYRLHVKVDPAQTDLALKEIYLSTAFEIYSNGELLLHDGQVKPFLRYTSKANLIAPIPQSSIKTGQLVLALRVHCPTLDWTTTHPGLYYQNLTLGTQEQLQDRIWASVLANSTVWIRIFVSLALGVVGLAFYVAQRQQTEFLWLCLSSAFSCFALSWIIFTSLRNVPVFWDEFNSSLNAFTPIFLVLTYFACMRQRVPFWVWMVNGSTLIFEEATRTSSNFVLLPEWVLTFGALLLILPEYVIINGLLLIHLRRGNREAAILLVPALLGGSQYIFTLTVFTAYYIPWLANGATRIISFYFGRLGPLNVNPNDIGDVAGAIAWIVILVFRSTRSSRQQAFFEGEIAAARQVQQVILPEQVESIPGFAIESVYEPAQQVGGDFFQILPTVDGGLLLVVGDVAGKGLPAAMLVSVLVGAIRSIADFTYAPEEMMARLNERLMGRANGGFSTALAAHITAEGEVTISNAGHLSPYLDGCEIELPSALPLGVVSGMRYETKHFQLVPGSRLTFYSDGVIEAQNEKGELLGFERGQELSTLPASEIARTAKVFGQSDDITVVTVARLTGVEEVLVSGSTRLLEPA